jgi:S1-C subfamily serine protease
VLSPGRQPRQEQQGVGSGAIIDAAGHIVTNNHVIEGAQGLRVVLPDGRTFDARLIGRDPQTDLAVVKIEGQNLPVVPLAPRVNVAVGDWVVAIGNALGLPGGPTVTAGVVGALGRTLTEPNGVALEDMIQTDAAINPGNSGGPLLNLAGEIVGINTAGIQGAEGLGFAVSVDTVHEVVPQLIQNGRVIRPFIGISTVEITPGVAATNNLPRQDGLLIVQVGGGTPAMRAGLRAGDIIVAVEGQPVKTQRDLRGILYQRKPGDTLMLTIQRGSSQSDVQVRLGEAPQPA